MKSGPYDKWGATAIGVLLGCFIIAVGLSAGVVTYDLLSQRTNLDGIVVRIFATVAGFAAMAAVTAAITIWLDALHERQKKRRNG